MKPFLIALALSASAITAGVYSVSTSVSAQTAHVLLPPDAIKWGPAPPVLPAGAQAAVVDGDPFKPGVFTLRLKFPDGYNVPAHWHPTDENITVIKGTFRAGMGDAHNAAGLHDFPTGSYIKMPKKMNHFATAKGETIIQIHGEGPFAVNYVNPNDDPTKKATGSR